MSIDRAGAFWAYTLGQTAPKNVPDNKCCVFRADTQHARWWKTGRQGNPFLWVNR